MSFFKSAKTEILNYNESISAPSTISKLASINRIASFYNQNPPVAEDIAERLASVAEVYKISKDPKDYIYVAVRALTADVPNENYDAFSEKELLRFEPKFACKVYQTFKMKPHHVNHRSADPKQARGVILDSHYNTKNDQHFPEILIAVDKTKDKKLAEGIVSGDIPGFSMGCTADFTICSVCNHKASSPSEFCNDVRFHKGKEINGKVAFEWCEGVCFEEESSVDDPADKNALTQEVILASKANNDLNIESEFLTLNSKVNQISNGLSKVMDRLEVKTASIKTADDTQKEKQEQDKTKVFEDYTKKKKEEDEKTMSGAEYGIVPDVETERGRGVENTAKKTEEKSADTKNANPYLKNAVDSKAKEYWTKFQGDYGKERTKDIKKKKLQAETEKKADSGQMWKGTAKGIGNPPALFKVDKKSGNPPEKFKFAGLYKDIEVFPAKKSYLVVAKSKRPIYLVACKEENVTLKQAALTVLKSVITDGLASTMKKYEAVKLKSIYTPTFKPSLVDEFSGDMRDKSVRTKPTEGANEDGIVDESKPHLKGKPREDGIDADGINTVKLSSSELSKRITAMQDIMQMIDEMEGQGKPQAEIVEKIDEWIEKWNMEGRPSTVPETTPGVEKPIPAKPSASTATSTIPVKMEAKKEEAKKESSVTDRALTDYSNQDRFRKEETQPVTAKGDDDLSKVERDSTKADEVWAAGKDDLNITRKHVVDLKASTEPNPYKRPRIVASTGGTEHSTQSKDSEEVNKENWKETSDKKWKQIQKAELEKIQKESAKQVAEFKSAFRQRMIKALKLASMRSDLNLIHSPLKEHLADTLIEENGDYTGMDADLATQLIETAVVKTGMKHIEFLLKEAEAYIDMPEESFLAIEDDTKKLNLVLPVADVSNHPGEEFPMSFGEGEEGFLEEGEPGMMKEELGGGEEFAEDLATKASRSNPVFAPHDSLKEGRFSELRGIFRDRFK